MSKAKQVDAAFIELQNAADAFYRAIDKFSNVYKPNAVGLDEWCESIDCTLGELAADIDETFADSGLDTL